MTQKIVYITGCLGFIGSYVTLECLRKGWHVRGIDKCTYAAQLNLIAEFKKWPNFVFERIDINDIDFLYDCDYVINTAAETHVANSIVRSEDFIHSNIDGVHHLLELIRNNRNEHKPLFLHFSTDEVYGDIVDGSHTEKDLLKPSNPYSATKAAGDMLILAWARTYKLPYIIVRPTNNYGIGQYVEKLIPKSVKYLSLGRPIPLHDKGTPTRNWLHAKDTAKAVEIILERGERNQIYNIAGHFEQSNLTTVQKIVQYYFSGESIPFENWICEEVRQGQDMRYAIDDTKLQDLGWYPLMNFETELPIIVEYYKENFVW
jgi:dTDP-glucose 4,6-dehydratase